MFIVSVSRFTIISSIFLRYQQAPSIIETMIDLSLKGSPSWAIKPD
jgi:hypothetical protein